MRNIKYKVMEREGQTETGGLNGEGREEVGRVVYEEGQLTLRNMEWSNESLLLLKPLKIYTPIKGIETELSNNRGDNIPAKYC